MDNIDELHHLPEGWHDGVAIAFSKAFQTVWMLMLGTSLFALISVIPVREHVLHSTLNRVKKNEPGEP